MKNLIKHMKAYYIVSEPESNNCDFEDTEDVVPILMVNESYKTFKKQPQSYMLIAKNDHQSQAVDALLQDSHLL